MTDIKPVELLALEMFEKLGFMLGDVAEKGSFDPGSAGWLRGSITFSGGRTGFVTIYVQKHAGTILAANILGSESENEVTPEEIMDAIKEFLNVFCGNVLTLVYGNVLVFNMGIPEVSETTGDAVKRDLNREDAGFITADGQPVIFIFSERQIK
jgi:hypothetical protein